MSDPIGHGRTAQLPKPERKPRVIKSMIGRALSPSGTVVLPGAYPVNIIWSVKLVICIISDESGAVCALTLGGDAHRPYCPFFDPIKTRAVMRTPAIYKLHIKHAVPGHDL